MLWYPAMMVVQLSNPILSELGWLDIGHRETKRETAPAPEKWGGNPGSLEMNTELGGFPIMFGVYILRFRDVFLFNSGSQISMLLLWIHSTWEALKWGRDCRIFRFHPFPNLTDTLDSPTKSLWCPNVVNDNWHVWADFDWFWKKCRHAMRSKNLLCKGITTNFNWLQTRRSPAIKLTNTLPGHIFPFFP